MAEVGEIRAKMVLSNEEFKRKLQESKAEMNKTGDSAKKMKQDFGAIQKASLVMGGAVVAAIGSSVAVAATFEQSMSKLGAISNASAEDMAKLESAAREMGATTQFSASQAAEGLTFLAMAGFSVEEQIDALPAVLNAAAAGGIDLARSADIVSNIMTGFGIEATESGHAVDVLVKTMTTANTDLPQLGEAMKMVAPVAASLGFSIEETATAVAKMSDAGIQGSMAGTSLRAAFLSLANPVGQTKKAMDELGFSVTDNEGKIKPLSRIVGELSEKMDGMSDAQKTATAAQLVGREAAAGFTTLLGIGEDQLADYTKELENSAGTADKMAKRMQDNLLGAFKEFQSALEEVGIKLGNEFLPMFTSIVREASKITLAFGEVDMATVKAGLAFGGTAAAIGLVLASIGKLVITMRTLMVSMGPAGWLITALSVLGGLFASASVYQSDYNDVTLENVNAMMKQRDELGANIEEFEKLRSKSQLTTDEFARFVDINSELAKTVNPDTIAKLTDEQERLREKSGLSNDELNRLIGLNDEIVEAVPESNTVLSEQGNILLENTDAAKQYNDEQLEMIRLELEAQRTKLEANMAEMLRDEEQAQKDINTAKERMIELDKMEQDEIRIIAGLNDELAIAKQNNDTLEIDRLNETIALHDNKLQGIAKQRAKQAEVVLEKAKEVDKIQEQIGKLDEVKQSMVALELKQAGINAKKGEEMKALDDGIKKLEKQKGKLDELKRSGEMNTAEYREARDAIDSQIGSLNGVRSKILDLIGQADLLNGRLGKSITKAVYITEHGGSGTGAKASVKRHQGGPLPKLHVGGIAEQFAQSPLHNEIDVRLLRNEMVLTEAQQSNLFRMLDAGIARAPQQSGSGNDLGPLIRSIEALGSRPVRVEVDGREIAAATFRDNDRLFSTQLSQEMRTQGVKR
ncbi:phage tail tape measure protein [Rossellomorea marisflavi]|uniref:phage tail tape measure protein n=1 Tax=Rossellomorea marisflavi TaxID=189381 RepID=UPI001315B43C|nr:phage tail tape measure protein [Rossellomorea marisflavi]QHA36850.1 phage tail tape measure protein [Rossellomorea marisflavi]